MTRARKTLVCLDETPYYHLTSRCVRRAFLCGVDRYSKRSFEHRRGWIRDRMRVLSAVFSIDVCAYAIMSNHYHLVVRCGMNDSWSDPEVVRRWARLFAVPVLVQRWRDGQTTTGAEEQAARALIDTWRARLGSVSWFMRCLNESIARRANAEDGCSGRFWQGRFHCQALLDERALLSAMAYVELNPIRARIATKPENSEFTSVQERIGAQPTDGLVAFSAPGVAKAKALPFAFPDYLELVEYTGRAVRANKNGLIAERTPPILDRLGIPAQAWLQTLRGFKHGFHTAIGPPDQLQARAHRLNQNWLCGLAGARLLYPTAA